MVILRQTLRSLCSPDGWTYAVFWKLKRRNRMVLTWEDGYFSMDTPGAIQKDQSADISSIDGNVLGMAVAKMSYHIYSFGEGVVGRVAFSGKHQWIFAPRSQGASGMDSRHGFSSMKGYGGCTGVDKYPSGWDDQFAAGVKTIAVIAVPEGVLQLGSSRSMPEDLKFVSHIRSLFAALQTVPGAFLSDLFTENALKAKSFPTPDATALAAAGFPPDIAASLGNLNTQSNFPGVSFPGAFNRRSLQPNLQSLQMPALAAAAPAAAPPAPSRPFAGNPLAVSSPSDLFRILGIPSDCRADDQNASQFLGSASLKLPADPKQEAAPSSDYPSTAKRVKVAPERTTRASVAISQIQLNFFDSDLPLGGTPIVSNPPLPSHSLNHSPVERTSLPSRHSSPTEASAHVLGPSGELLGRAEAGAGAGPGAGAGATKRKAVVDLEKELCIFHNQILNDPSPSLANLPPSNLPSANLPSANLPSASSAAQKPMAAGAAASGVGSVSERASARRSLGVAGGLAGLDEQLLAGMTASGMTASGMTGGNMTASGMAGNRNGNAAARASQFNSSGGAALGSSSAFGGADELAQALGLHFTGQLPVDLADLAYLDNLADIGANQVSANGQMRSAMSRGVFDQAGAVGAASRGADAGGSRGGFPMASGPSGPPQPQKLQHRAGVAPAAGSTVGFDELSGSLSRAGAVNGGVEAGMGGAGAGMGTSLAEMERMATLEALMRTSGMLPRLSLAELQQSQVLSTHNSVAGAAAAAAEAASAGMASGVKVGGLPGLQSRASVAGKAAGDGGRGVRNVEPSGKGVFKSETALKALPDRSANAGVHELGVPELCGGGAAAAAAAGKEEKKGTKKRGREEKPKQRPRDRQLIQDRVKDLRGIVPNSERLSIDGLLERTIQHLVFLREFSALRADIDKGQAMLADKSFDECMSECPVSVQQLSPTLVQIKVEWIGSTVPIDLADGLRQIGLVVRKSSVKSTGGRVKAHIIAECKQLVERMDIMWHVLQHLKDKLPDMASVLSGTEKQVETGKVDSVFDPADSCRQVVYQVRVMSA
ncbi:unnamed protein product [Closterium sp. Yama58-4]|nr:unnamed protein product [Closterium sp. Yama58-4]